MPAPDFTTYAKKLTNAARRVDTTATDAQREAGNFRHGKLFAHGLEIMVEHPKGSIRTGVGPDGKKWRRIMSAHYGRIKRTVGLDAENVDVFLGPHPESQLVFVISQLDQDGNLDEHKCVLGTRNVDEAKKLYLDHYPNFWESERLGEIRGYFFPDFKKFLASNAPKKNKTKSAGYAEACAHCGTKLEIDPDSGICNRCSKPNEKKAYDDQACPDCGGEAENKHTRTPMRICSECDNVWFVKDKEEKKSFDLKGFVSVVPECR